MELHKLGLVSSIPPPASQGDLKDLEVPEFRQVNGLGMRDPLHLKRKKSDIPRGERISELDGSSWIWWSKSQEPKGLNAFKV